MAEKTRISPAVCAMPDDRHQNLHIEVELPGVEKKDIDLAMHEDSFFVKASRDDLEFVGSFALCCPVDYEKAKAKYNNGLLTIDVPYLTVESRAKKIPVQ